MILLPSLLLYCHDGNANAASYCYLCCFLLEIMKLADIKAFNLTQNLKGKVAVVAGMCDYYHRHHHLVGATAGMLIICE